MSDSKKNDGMDLALSCTGALVMLPALIVLGEVGSGLVLRQLWTWFVVPQFGLAPLSLAVAIGLCAITGLVQPYQNPPKDPDATGIQILGKAVGVLTLKPAMYLAIGYVAHWFAK